MHHVSKAAYRESVIKKLSQRGFPEEKSLNRSNNFISDRIERLAAWMHSNISTLMFIFFITSSSVFAIMS